MNGRTISVAAVLLAGVLVLAMEPRAKGDSADLVKKHEVVRYAAPTEEEGVALGYLQRDIDDLVAKQVSILQHSVKRLGLAENEVVSWDRATRALKITATVADAVAPQDSNSKP